MTRARALAAPVIAGVTGFVAGGLTARARTRNGSPDVRRIADEQAALRRVATLVARPARPDEVFGAVAEEVGRLLDADLTALGRYEPDGLVTGVGVWSARGDHREPGVRATIGAAT